MVSPFIHPDLLRSLYSFYPALCTIQQDIGTTSDSYGSPIPSWQNLVGHVNLDCYKGATGGQEVQRPDQTIAVSDFAIEFAGYYPSITTRMRAVVGTTNHDILSVQSDSQAQTTKLLVKVVTP